MKCLSVFAFTAAILLWPTELLKKTMEAHSVVHIQHIQGNPGMVAPYQSYCLISMLFNRQLQNSTPQESLPSLRPTHPFSTSYGRWIPIPLVSENSSRCSLSRYKQIKSMFICFSYNVQHPLTVLLLAVFFFFIGKCLWEISILTKQTVQHSLYVCVLLLCFGSLRPTKQPLNCEIFIDKLGLCSILCY